MFKNNDIAMFTMDYISTITNINKKSYNYLIQKGLNVMIVELYNNHASVLTPAGIINNIPLSILSKICNLKFNEIYNYLNKLQILNCKKNEIVFKINIDNDLNINLKYNELLLNNISSLLKYFSWIKTYNINDNYLFISSFDKVLNYIYTYNSRKITNQQLQEFNQRVREIQILEHIVEYFKVISYKTLKLPNNNTFKIAK